MDSRLNVSPLNRVNYQAKAAVLRRESGVLPVTVRRILHRGERR